MRTFLIIIITFILFLIATHFILLDRIDLFGEIRYALFGGKPPKVKSSLVVRKVMESDKPLLVHGEQFGLWAQLLEQQRELIPIFKIGGKKSGDRRLQFFSPKDLVVDSTGRIYVLDQSYGRVIVISPKGEYLRTVYLRADSETPFQDPSIIAIGPNSNLYVYDSLQRILIMSPLGEELARFKVNYATYDFTVDSKGNIYLLSPGEEFRIHKLNPNGREMIAFAKQEAEEKQLWDVFSRGRLAVGPQDDLFYSLEYPYRIIKYSSDGKALLSFDRDLGTLLTPPTIRRDYKGRVTSVSRQQMTWDIKVAEDGKVYNITRKRGAKGGDVLDVFDASGQYLQSFHLNATVKCFDFAKNDEIVFLLPRPLRRVEKYRIALMAEKNLSDGS